MTRGTLETGDLMSDNSFHVMFLTRHQQVTVRLVMFDLLAKHVRLNLDRVVEDGGAPESGDSAFSSIVAGMDLYERIVDILPTPDMFPKAKDMTVQLDPKSMEFVVKGVNFYDPNNSVLSPQERQYVANHFGGVRDLVNKAKNFTYTAEDIRRVQKGGK